MDANIHEPEAGLYGLIPLLVMSLFVAIIAHLLAKDKGRNVALWTVLGCIPLVNWLCMSYFIGASNLRVERKIDDLLNIIKNT